MYIVAIAWIYVTLMVSVAQPSALRGILTFIGTGLLPLALFLWLVGTPQRRRNRAREEARNADASPGTQAADTGVGGGDTGGLDHDAVGEKAADARPDAPAQPDGTSRG